MSSNTFIENDIVYDREKISTEILEIHENDPNTTLIDCIIDYSIANDIEIEVLSKLLTYGILEKLEEECELLNLIKKNQNAKLHI